MKHGQDGTSARSHLPRRCQQTGGTLIESLVALMVVSFALVGLLGLNARSAEVEFESYQREQAVLLLNDMAARLISNRSNADDYQASNVGAVNDSCETDTQAARDLCDWAALLRGAAERDNGVNVGALLGAVGCVVRTAPGTYVISIAWRGLFPTAAPGAACGRELYTDQAMRRAASTTVRIATLGA